MLTAAAAAAFRSVVTFDSPLYSWRSFFLRIPNRAGRYCVRCRFAVAILPVPSLPLSLPPLLVVVYLVIYVVCVAERRFPKGAAAAVAAVAPAPLPPPPPPASHRTGASQRCTRKYPAYIALKLVARPLSVFRAAEWRKGEVRVIYMAQFM